jgi:DNA-binding NtrC family response regulator
MRNATILFLEEEPGLQDDLKSHLRSQNLTVFESEACSEANRAFVEHEPDLVVLATSSTDLQNDLETVEEIRDADKATPIILITTSSSETKVLAAFRAGVNDYFTGSFSNSALASSIDRLLQDGHPDRPPPLLGDRLIGGSEAIREIREYLPHVAATDCTVLITGETGTGKELAAELIHESSPRRKRPFVCINSAALPDTLLESELFGHERGSFTGAISLQRGKFELADGGTVFLDEIGDMSLFAQAKILRIIETKKLSRVGGQRRLPLDIRIIAASNQDLEKRVNEGKFRADLFYRLAVAQVHFPPLRERKDDIVPLFEHYISELNRKLGKNVQGFTEKAMTVLLKYDWPGNVRELKNILEATFINLRSRRISITDFPKRFQRRLEAAEGLPTTEREQLLSALYATNWNKSKAAEKLHWSRMTLYRKMSKYHIFSSHP